MLFIIFSQTICQIIIILYSISKNLIIHLGNNIQNQKTF